MQIELGPNRKVATAHRQSRQMQLKSSDREIQGFSNDTLPILGAMQHRMKASDSSAIVAITVFMSNSCCCPRRSSINGGVLQHDG